MRDMAYMYLKTDLYRDKSGTDYFCFRKDDEMVCLERRLCISYTPITMFANSQMVKYDYDVEHESHFYRNDVHIGSSRFFRAARSMLEDYIKKDQFIEPVDELDKVNYVTYRIDSHSWGTLLTAANMYNTLHEFSKTDWSWYDHAAEVKKLNLAKSQKTADFLKKTLGMKVNSRPGVLPSSASYNGPHQPPFKFDLMGDDPKIEFADSSPMVRKSEA